MDDCVITGSGDYVASLIAMYVSGYKTTCCHPMDIVLNPAIVRNRKVYLVSVSGATKATIRAAKVANKSALKTIAITTRAESPPQKALTSSFQSDTEGPNIPTSGTIGFTASMLCCLSLVCKVKVNTVKKIYYESIALADYLTNYKIKKSSSYMILGNGIVYPVERLIKDK